MNDKKSLGQFFTSKQICNFMIDKITKNKNSSILEPSCGEGVFCDLLSKRKFKNVTALEVDKKIAPSYALNKSFLSHSFEEKFDAVIGNPPYVRWKNLNNTLKNELETNIIWQKYYNSLCDYYFIFIHKSIDLLKKDGELIFITPEYWLKNFHAQSLRNYILENGHLSEIFYLGENKYFSTVTSSFIIFKFLKNKNTKHTKIFKISEKTIIDQNLFKDIPKNFKKFDVSHFNKNQKFLLFNSNIIKEANKLEKLCKNSDDTLDVFVEHDYVKLSNVANIANGLVSGLDKAFRIDKSSINKLNVTEKNAIVDVIKSKNTEKYFTNDFENYIFLNNLNISSEKELKSKYPNLYKHLSVYKEKLKLRYDYNKNINYWDWVFLRNFKIISSNQKKICIPCKLRIENYSDIKFTLVNEKSLLTQDVTSIFINSDIKEDIHYFLAYLNSDIVKNWIYINNNNRANVLEFSEAPLNEIPIKRINWDNDKEITIHDEIISLTKKLIEKKDLSIEKEINSQISFLLNPKRD